jgi:hypothetical protein
VSGGEGVTVDVRILTRAEMALSGVRVDSPVRRPDGAGPSGDDHVLIDGVNAALPTNPASPYTNAACGACSLLPTAGG